MKKMRCPNTTILTVCFVLLTLSAQMTLALSLRLSKILQQNDQTREAQELKEPQQNWLDTRSEGDPILQKRTCNTFPCMYSHLGTKAGRASLYRTLAGFIDDCLNDASCDPGRRKRSRIQRMNIKRANRHVIHSGLQRRLKNTKLSRTISKDTEPITS